jgi:hypothetical protein
MCQGLTGKWKGNAVKSNRGGYKMADGIDIIKGLDMVCRGMVRKLTHRVVVIEKKLKIMIRFVLRRSKEVNGRLDDLETIAGIHTRSIGSVRRCLEHISKLLNFQDIRASKVEDRMIAFEGDMDDNSEDCADMWNRIRNLEGLATSRDRIMNDMISNIDGLCESNTRLKNKVDALEKLHTTKISAFIYGPTDPDIVQLQNKVEDLEKLHTTQIDGAVVNQGPPDSTLGSTCFKGTGGDRGCCKS